MTSRRLEGFQFGQRRPPLSDTIKRVLDRYPDGQIFKASSRGTFTHLHVDTYNVSVYRPDIL